VQQLSDFVRQNPYGEHPLIPWAGARDHCSRSSGPAAPFSHGILVRHDLRGQSDYHSNRKLCRAQDELRGRGLGI
jgi:hypothetical protein